MKPKPLTDSKMHFHLLHLQSYPIFEQLKLEEILLRTDSRNWCIINEGSSPAIVMGISGKKEEWIDTVKASQDKIPIIKRFSGGGTVVVDHNTLFVTFICQKELHPFPAYPEPIMRWSEEIYRDIFSHEQFQLRENDFVFGERKFGGNAQYIKKERWLHHTSFLWDYTPQNMEYLLHPKKAPHYRANRPHDVFLCRLKEHFSHLSTIVEGIKTALKKRYSLQPISLQEALSSATTECRQTTHFIV
jgi:lipoate-protein ligase A